MLTPDSIVPDAANPQSYNRYSYVVNNPLKLTDPSGHAYDAGSNEAGNSCNYDASLYACIWPDGYEKAGYPFDRNPVDAHGLGASLAGGVSLPFFNASGVVAGETVVNPGSHEITTFFVYGYDYSVGEFFIPTLEELVDGKTLPSWLDKMFGGKKGPPLEGSATGSIYYAAIHNVEENRKYWGEFQGRMVTIAAGQGVTFGRAVSPDDPYLEKAYSDIIGYVAVGGGLSVDYNRVWYVPVLQYNWETGVAEFLVFEYIADATGSENP